MLNNFMSINDAINALKNKNPELALTICNKLISLNPNNADAFHVKALGYKLLNDVESAKKHFKLSLKIQPKQSVVHSNYANLLLSNNEYEQASIEFKHAVALTNTNIDAWYNWAILFYKTKQYQLAQEKLQIAINLNCKDYRLYNLLGDIYQKQEHFHLAISSYNQALMLNPKCIQAIHNKGITHRLMGQAVNSIQCYSTLLDLNLQYPELFFNLGCSYYDLNNNDMAVKYLKSAIGIKPNYVEAHEALNKLYWEENNTQDFLTSYESALSNPTHTFALIYSYIAMLIMSKKLDDALVVVEDSIQKNGRLHPLLHAMAVIKGQNSKNEDVLSLLFEALDQSPKNPKYLIEIANVYISAKNFNEALKFIKQAEIIAPLNQEILAYKATCLRLLEDSKSDWLNNYDQFISAELIEVPNGYTDLNDFINVLKLALHGLHKTEKQPLDQSVNGGTQTVGHLLNEPVKVIQDFKYVLEKRIQNYLDNLPNDPSHPFLNRKTKKFKFSGSWSVKLYDGGYHVNHVHPEGWLSCCTYIDLPAGISEHDPDRAGWIKFGETSLGLKENEKTGKEICPKSGLCVLFPSYFWHGTHPFHSDTNRLTIPCDIMPL